MTIAKLMKHFSNLHVPLNVFCKSGMPMELNIASQKVQEGKDFKYLGAFNNKKLTFVNHSDHVCTNWHSSNVYTIERDIRF